MESPKKDKAAKLIQKTLSDFFLKEGRILLGKSFTTITRVRVTPDLSIAKVYLSIYNADDKKLIIEHIKGNTTLIRKSLGNTIRHQIRKIPELHFYLDDSLDYYENINNLLKK